MRDVRSVRQAGDGSAKISQATERCDLLIRNGYLVSMDAQRRVFASGAIAIRGNAILAVGSDKDICERYTASRSIDAQGSVVHPGFIDAHNHVVHVTCRGIFDSAAASAGQPVTFADWKADVTPDDENVATQLAALEMLRHGFTTVIEPGSVFDVDAAAEGAEAVGIRILLAGCYLWDSIEGMSHLSGLGSRSLYEKAPAGFERCLDELGSQLHRNGSGRVHGYVAVYGLGTASDELLRAAKKVADEAGVAFHQHEGYVPEASAADRRQLGKSRIAHLADLGVLGSGSTLVHLNVLDDDDMRIVAESGTAVVWCPLAYQQLGIADTARCRLPELHERGVTVALGSDGALDFTIGDAGPAAYMLARSLRRFIGPSAILEMQTINAARAAGLGDQIGSLEPGKRADVVIRQRDAAEVFPAINPVHQLALNCRGGTVDTVIVNGDVALEGGRPTRVDGESVLGRAKASVERRMARLGLKPFMEWPVVDGS